MKQLLTVALAFLSVLILFHAVDAFAFDAGNTGKTNKACPDGVSNGDETPSKTGESLAGKNEDSDSSSEDGI